MSYPYAIPHPRPPADRPELPEGVSPSPPWPAWYGPIALLVGIVVTFIAVVIVEGVAHALDRHVSANSPALNDTLTVVQDGIFVATAIAFAAMTRRPRAWHFGLRGARFGRTLGWAAAGIGAFLFFELVYAALLHPKGRQTVTQDLGANTSTLALAAGAFIVIVVAPVAEELFFRGFFYRALRGRFSVFVAALIDGIVFGAIHYTGSDVLTVLPILAVLGFTFCLVYERTGTIYATIALHASNNWLAYASQTKNGAVVSTIFGVAMLIAACVAILKTPRAASTS